MNDSSKNPLRMGEEELPASPPSVLITAPMQIFAAIESCLWEKRFPDYSRQTFSPSPSQSLLFFSRQKQKGRKGSLAEPFKEKAKSKPSPSPYEYRSPFLLGFVPNFPGFSFLPRNPHPQPHHRPVSVSLGNIRSFLVVTLLKQFLE